MSPEQLAAHLQETYGIRVVRVAELDVGVFRIDPAEGARWVARVFPETRPLEGAEGDAAILRRLEGAGFPAERCAHPDPVSSFEGRGVLVTDFVEPAAPLRPGRAAAILGALLGGLHARPGDGAREGGAWHHLSYAGGPREEVAAATDLLEEALPRVGVRQLGLYDQLCDEVEGTDDCHDLPHAFVHPDFVLANAIPTPDESLVIVDWAGAGRGPRLWSLGFLLWAAGATSHRLIDLVVSRYRRRVALEPAELDRLPAAIRARPIMLECWAFCHGRRELGDAVERVSEVRDRAEQIAAHARAAFKDA